MTVTKSSAQGINGSFVRTVIAVTAGLMILGVGATVTAAFDTNAKLAAIDVHLANIYDRLENLEDARHTP